MKIERIETIPVRLPPRRPHQWAGLSTAIGAYVIVKVLTDEGVVGWGEAPVLKDWGGDHMRYYGETPRTTIHVIEEILAPALAGEDPRRFEALHASMDRAVKGYPYAKAAVDMALYDIAGKASGVPAYQLLGGCFRGRVAVAHSIGLMEIERAVEEAVAVAAEGIGTIKLKGGRDPARDARLVREVRKAVGAQIGICVDANQGYATPRIAVRAIKAMEEAGLLYVEQPVEGIEAMAEVARRVDTPLMADESAWTPQDVIEIARRRAADMISLYTTKPGGLLRAKKVAAVAEAAGLRCNVNGSVETGVGNAANLQLAASTAVASLACVIPVSTPAGKGKKGIAGIYYLDDLIREPFAYRDGAIEVPSGPGLGIEVDEEKLARYRAG
jgi:muconate cycloisomerase